MSRGRVWRRLPSRLSVLTTVLLVLGSLVALEGSLDAAAAIKSGTVTLVPTSLAAGTTYDGSASITVTNNPNTASTIGIGSWDVDYSLFTVTLPGTTFTASNGGVWEVQVCTGAGAPIPPCRGNGHIAGRTTGSTKLMPGQFLTVGLSSLVAGCTTGTGASTVWVATDGTASVFDLGTSGRISVTANSNLATHAIITSLTDNGGAPWVSSGSPFTVGVQTVNANDVEAPPCGSMPVTLSRSAGTGTLSGTLTTSVTAPSTTGTISPATYTALSSSGELGVRLCVAPYSTDATHANHCKTLDFAAQGGTVSGSTDTDTFSLTVPPTGGGLSALSSTSSTPSCTIDATHQLCGVWVFPNGSGGTTVYATFITCGTSCKGGISVKTQSLASLSGYDNSGPNKFYQLYLFCGSNTCPGNLKSPNGISNYAIQTLASGTWTSLPACTSSVNDMIAYSGHSSTTLQACTDYNSSNRSPGSNTLMLVGRFALPMNVDPGGRIG
jgi:hypothetical protein